MSNAKKTYDYNHFPYITGSAELKYYLDGRVYGHGDYCHYTSLAKIDKILKSKGFALNSFAGFNDKKDIEQFAKGEDEKEKLKNKFFVFCFATGITENLSLWYLYSGIEGKGARIKINKNNFKKLKEKSEFYLCEGKCGDYDPDDANNIKLDKEKFNIYIGDVLYYSETLPKGQKYKDTVSLKYNNLRNYKIKKDVFEDFKNTHKYFLKNLIWYYEKETRIVAELKDKFFDTLDKNKDYYIMMTFPPDMNMEITTAPEIENNTEIDFNNYPNILNFIVDTSKLKLSEHCGELKMRLYNNKCDKCKFTFEEKTQQSAEAAAAKE